MADFSQPQKLSALYNKVAREMKLKKGRNGN